MERGEFPGIFALPRLRSFRNASAKFKLNKLTDKAYLAIVQNFKFNSMPVSHRKESKVRLHPTSALLETPDGGAGGGSKKVSSARNRNSVAQIPTDWFIFDEMVR